MTQFIYARLFAATILLMPITFACAETQKNDIEIAIAPFLPVQTLVKNYAPLREYLQNKLNIPISIISAPNYQTFFKRTEQMEYPIIVTPANSAWLAWADSGYIPLLRPLVFTRPIVITTLERPFSKLSDLRGKTVTLPDATAIISMQGMQILKEAGLKPGLGITVKNMPNHGVAVNHVITGEADAAIVSDRALQQMPAQVRDKVKIVYTWDKGAAPGIVYLGNPNLPREKLEQIKQAILEFAQQTPEGIKLMKETGYEGLTAATSVDLQPLQPYGEMLKKAVAGENP